MSMTPKKILIVDDDPGFLSLIVDYFKPKGYRVFTSNNLEDTIRLFQKEHPKVVLLDFNMPLVTGEKLLPVLQTIDPAVRVIVVTGLAQGEVEEKFKGSGYFAFFEKGNLSFEALKTKVDEALDY